MNIKKIIAGILACCIVGGVMPTFENVTRNTVITASAEDYTEGTYEQLTYKNYGDYIEISNCDESATEVEIPYEIDGLPVTIIWKNAFENCSINSITIPQSVTFIGSSAFADCSNLTSIVIPNSVTEICSYAFQNCSSLEEIIIPESVKKIDYGVFRGCTSLTSIKIPYGVKDINSYAFYGCTSLGSVIIPDSVTDIGSSAFYDCANLDSVIIPDSVTDIDSSAFYDCTNLKSIIIPDSVEYIGGYAFSNTLWLKKKRSENPLVIVNDILIDAQTCEGDIIIPDGVKKIASSAFKSCADLKSITIPDSVTYIYRYVFADCWNLTSITIPDNISYIGNYAFSGCNSLKEVYYNGSLVQFNNITEVDGNDSIINIINEKFNDGEPSQYSYELIPLLAPFNDYFYVKTENPNPFSFRFTDKESVYSDNSVISICETTFADVKYKNIKTLRVNDGYIFSGDNTDGGTLTLQTKVNGEWEDSDITLMLPVFYDNCDYLINTYATKDNFFDNMDAVQSGFRSICLYSGSYIRGEIFRERKFWSMASAAHIDQLLYIYSPYDRDSKSLFASSIYPFRYDSLGFPGMMTEVSERLDSSSSYQWSGSSHDTVNITYNGETRSYGGQGSVKGQGISEDKIMHYFTLDDNDEEITLENIKQLLVDYSKIEMDDDIPRDDELTWADVCDTVDNGAWVTVCSNLLSNGEFGFGGYTYLYKKNDNESYFSEEWGIGEKLYQEGSLGCISDTWVDGRYIGRFRTYISGATFDEHPESNILLYQTTVPDLKDYDYKRIYNSDTEEYEYVYSNIEIGETVKTVNYKYDSTDKIWKASIDEYDTIVDMVEKGLIDEKYLDMIQLTPDEVEALEVDRNTNVTPDHYYIYDGTAEPGTEFFAGTGEVTTTTNTTTSTTSTTITTTKPTTTLTTSTTTTTTKPTTTSTTSTTTTTSKPTTTSTTSTTTTTSTTSTTTTTTEFTTTTTSTTIVTDTPVSDLLYKKYNDHVEITGCNKDDITDVRIPAEIEGLPVTEIGYGAFYECSNLKSVVIPDSVTIIDSCAFFKCSRLENVTIPESVTSIDGDAFYGTKWLSNRRAENPLVIINNILIDGSNCTGDVVIPDGVTSIEHSAFSLCSGLTSIIIPDSVTSIGGHTFESCKNLKSVKIPNNITNIFSFTFSRCSSLESIEIPDSVTSIGEGAFLDCSNLKLIKIPNSVTRIGNLAFENCASLESIVIPDGVAEIRQDTFKNCTSLKSVTISDNVTYIVYGAFENCSNLESITIENPKCEIYNSESTISETAIIYGYSNSTAQKYAEKYNRTFVKLDESEIVLGDVNGDGMIDAVDATAVLVEYANLSTGGSETFSSEQKSAGDVNRDNMIDAVDASMILTFYAYLSTGGIESDMRVWLDM